MSVTVDEMRRIAASAINSSRLLRRRRWPYGQRLRAIFERGSRRGSRRAFGGVCRARSDRCDLVERGLPVMAPFGLSVALQVFALPLTEGVASYWIQLAGFDRLGAIRTQPRGLSERACHVRNKWLI